MAKISKSAAKVRIEALSEELKRHNYNYYVLNNPVITDFEFDLKMQELQALEAMFPDLALPDSPTQHVGSDIEVHDTGAPPQTPPLRAGYSSILPARAALAPDGATFLAKICP